MHAWSKATNPESEDAKEKAAEEWDDFLKDVHLISGMGSIINEELIMLNDSPSNDSQIFSICS